jgi:hypothetical protein
MRRTETHLIKLAGAPTRSHTYRRPRIPTMEIAISKLQHDRIPLQALDSTQTTLAFTTHEASVTSRLLQDPLRETGETWFRYLSQISCWASSAMC